MQNNFPQISLELEISSQHDQSFSQVSTVFTPVDCPVVLRYEGYNLCCKMTECRTVNSISFVSCKAQYIRVQLSWATLYPREKLRNY